MEWPFSKVGVKCCARTAVDDNVPCGSVGGGLHLCKSYDDKVCINTSICFLEFLLVLIF